MRYNYPSPIVSENDLEIYEEKLREENNCKTDTPDYSMQIEPRRNMPMVHMHSGNMPESLTNTAFLPAYLHNHIGKLVKIESLIGGCLESRIGTLLGVGADYIVIKLYQTCSSMVCDAASVKYITIVHDNDMNKAGLY